MVDLKKEILNNKFIDLVRIDMHFNESDYENLCSLLKRFCVEHGKDKVIDKELGLSLYSMPTIVRNMYLSFDEASGEDPFPRKLEDAWLELDALVTECFCVNENEA